MQRIHQPDAARIPGALIDDVVSIARRDTDAEPEGLDFRHQHSNDIAMVHFDDGRTLILKRARHDWAFERFEAARIASELLRTRVEVVAPAPLDLPPGIDSRPLEAYWRIDLPLLEKVWPALSAESRHEALWSWGEMIREVHSVKLPGFGPLPRIDGGPERLTDFLESDLADRLLPAVTGEWPEGREVVESLIGAMPEVETRADRVGTLVHGDLHPGNVLCRIRGDRVRCVGLLDWEAARSSIPEADLAYLEVIHTPLFERPIPPGWLDSVVDGYGGDPDPFLLAFYRIYHLANMGFWSALVGHEWHAGEVAAAARAELSGLELMLASSARHSVPH